MAEEAEAEAEEAAAAGASASARSAQQPSQMRIPTFNVAALLRRFTTAIGSEAGNADVKKAKLPATATAAQRSAFDENYVFNEETKQTEHKDTIIARDQHQAADSKAAPGRLRYTHGTKMAIISEDGDGTRGASTRCCARRQAEGASCKPREGRCCLTVCSRWALRASSSCVSASAMAVCATRA